MLIVPELETVFILVPRTGTGTLYREMLRVHPRAMLLYRHMEADGVPQGYDRWKRIGFVRNPLNRLWSLYNFMLNFAGGALIKHSDDAARARRQVEGKTFEEWLLTNNEPWTSALSINGDGAYWPLLSRRNAAPENKLSQFSYLRPDLGTEIRKFENLRPSLQEWGCNPEAVKNATAPSSEPEVTSAMCAHFNAYCAWDIAQGCRK